MVCGGSKGVQAVSFGLEAAVPSELLPGPRTLGGSLILLSFTRGSGNRRLVQLDGERLGLLDISPQHEQSTLSLQIMDARTGSLLGQTSGANHQVRIDNALVLTPNSADLPTSTLVWIDSGRLLSLKLGDKLGRPSRLDAYGRSPVAQVQDVGLAHLGLFVAHHEDGTAAAIACAEGRLELRWQFADAVRSCY